MLLHPVYVLYFVDINFNVACVTAKYVINNGMTLEFVLMM